MSYLPRNGGGKKVESTERRLDLVDLMLLSRDSQVDKLRVLNALRDIFEQRNTHALPGSLIAPPYDLNHSYSATNGAHVPLRGPHTA
jgi:hypothetical protein